MIPYESEYTLIGTTDVAVADGAATPRASAEEVDYLCRAVNRYLARPLAPADVVWSYAGVRPLYDDGTSDPSAITRDYTLRLDDDAGSAPVLSVFGGKITTYRKLAENALEKLTPWFSGMRAAWTASAPLPGGDLHGAGFEAFTEIDLRRDLPWLPDDVRRALARRHGANTIAVIGGAKSLSDLGTYFGAGLYAREIDYMIAHEWALSGEDILYRRTKAGLHLSPKQRGTVAVYLERALQHIN